MAQQDEFKSKEISNKIDKLMELFEQSIKTNKDEIKIINNRLERLENDMKQIKNSNINLNNENKNAKSDINSQNNDNISFNDNDKDESKINLDENKNEKEAKGKGKDKALTSNY